METLSTSLIGLALGFCGINHVNADPLLKPVLADRCEDPGDTLDFDYASIKASIAREFSGGRAPNIFYALGKERRTLLKRLLADGINPNVCHAGFSPLMMAVASGDVEEVAILLDGGANPDKPLDTNGGTPLLYALGMARLEVAKLLLARGANPLHESDGGLTGLHELALTVVTSGGPAGNQKLELADELIHSGVPVNSQTTTNKATPLMFAAIRGDRPLVALLVQSGADVSIRDRKGQTAEDFARKKGHTEIVELLNHAPATPRSHD